MVFGKYPDRVKPEPTPERVRALLQLVSKGSSSKEELRNRLTLKGLVQGDGAAVFNQVYDAAMELDLTSQHDGIVKLAIDAGLLADTGLFRRFMADAIFRRKDTTFFLITERFLELNEDVLPIAGWEEASARLSNDNLRFREEDLLGWRLWVSFLGIGYLYDRTVIANLAVRIGDALRMDTDLPAEQDIPIARFVAWLEARCPETAKSRNSHTLGLGVSNGLRLLAGQRMLEMQNLQDAERWQLFPIETRVNSVTHVRVRR